MLVKVIDINYADQIAAVVDSRYVTNDGTEDYWPDNHTVFAILPRDRQLVIGKHYHATPINKFYDGYYVHFDFERE